MNRLKELRTAANLSQADIADKIGLSRSAYSNIENGNRAITAETLSDIADVLNVSMDYLYGRSDDSTAPSSISVSYDEFALIRRFRSLNTEGRHALMTTADIIAGNPDMQKNRSLEEATS